MKKTIAILLVLVLAGFGLFAVVDHEKDDATINVKTIVNPFSAFGVSEGKVDDDAFKTIANFQKAVSSSVDKTIGMLDLKDYVLVGNLSGINNTATPVKLEISIKDLQTESGKNSVALILSTTGEQIAASANSAFGTLKNIPIRVKEKVEGAAALAPAGTYSTIITISLTT